MKPLLLILLLLAFLILIVLIGPKLYGESAPQPIPILQSDADEYRTAISLYQQAVTHFNVVRYHACLAAQVTEEECGQPDLQGRGFVIRLPKPAPPKGER